ncbi:MAG: bifunctional hydroxymethylpyrimidine kinase/phosphomethylpyrimidine kinase [Acidobacteria bacterium]|nr:bifunctional hydroxymethylpyrimidine kinase/phosphomethylpyrimidine kinase [Acidobacteriota bacterium]
MTQQASNTPPVVLAVAGLDPSGGAGLVADVRTLAAFGCYACAAVTSVTFQNTAGYYGAEHQSAASLRAQVLPVLDDLKVAAWKTGMLPTREIVEEVARLARETSLRDAPLVVDPVVRSTTGSDLIGGDALAALRSELLPLARVATPNVPEAERITGMKIESGDDLLRAARMMRGMGARAVLVKGGHSAGAQAVDVLDDGGEITYFTAQRVDAGETHGTGCTLASAIAACLARRLALDDAVGVAKRFVTEGLRRASRVGHGASPVSQAVAVEFTERGVRVAGE